MQILRPFVFRHVLELAHRSGGTPRRRTFDLVLALALLSTTPMGCDAASSGKLGGYAAPPDEDGALSSVTVDPSSLVPAQVLTPYSAQLALVGYDDPVTWTLTSGELPTGLTLSSSGLVAGTPTWLDEWSFKVQVVAEAGGQLEESLLLSTFAGDNIFVGFEHERVNNMTDEFDLMSGMWLRISGSGEQGLETYAPDIGLYGPGPNGIVEEGWGDDVRVGNLDLEELDVEIVDWQPTGPVDAYPGHPSDHHPEDDPPTLTSDNSLEAGADAGEATVRFAADEGEPLEVQVLLVPPDWCPLGVDAVGGGGGPSSTRYCE